MSEYNDLIENPTSRCSCMLALDVSGSMTGEPISELNEGVKQFIQEVKDDDFASNAVDLGIITFGGTVKEIIQLRTIAEVTAPIFYANGDTPMGQAVDNAIRLLEERKNLYKSTGVSYYQPWLVLMSDGEPTDNYREAASKLQSMAVNKKVLVFGVGVGNSCNLGKLAEFCPPERPPKKLSGLKFSQFFKWLSQSMARVSVSTPGTGGFQLPPTGGWEEIDKI
jgi:uncharacterized protein YegL